MQKNSKSHFFSGQEAEIVIFKGMPIPTVGNNTKRFGLTSDLGLKSSHTPMSTCFDFIQQRRLKCFRPYFLIDWAL